MDPICLLQQSLVNVFCDYTIWFKWSLSCAQSRKSPCTKAIHIAMICTYSVTVLTSLSTLLTKSEDHGTIGIALTIITTLVLRKRSAYKVWPFFAIQKHTNYACKTYNTKIQSVFMLIRKLHRGYWGIVIIVRPSVTKQLILRWARYGYHSPL